MNNVEPAPAVAAPRRVRARPGRSVVVFVRRHRAPVAGAVVLIGFVALALLAPLVSPHGADARVGQRFAAPSLAYPLGLDDRGSDVLSLLIWSTRVSILVGFVAGSMAVIIGGGLGLIAGYVGGATRSVLSATADYFLVIPVLPLAIIAAALWGPSLRNEIIIIGLLSWMPTMRLVQAQVMSVKERTYVTRTRALGATHARLLSQHIVPAVAPLLVASTVLSIGNAVFFEAALSFLGLGDPTQPSWGKMIADAFRGGVIARGAWWAIIPPGLIIGTTVLAATLVGRGIEESLNPRVVHSQLGRWRLRSRAPGSAGPS